MSEGSIDRHYVDIFICICTLTLVSNTPNLMELVSDVLVVL